MEITDETIGLLFSALSDQLQALGSSLEIVVIGGSALTALGLVKRATRDVDLLAIAGFMSRVTSRSYGPALMVYFASRLDQIHFKLFAMVDQGGGRHEADLRELNPSPEEPIAAARWSMTQDPSPGYRSVLAGALEVLGVNDADLSD